MTIKECVKKIKDASTGGYSMVEGEATEIMNTFLEVDAQLEDQEKRIAALEGKPEINPVMDGALIGKEAVKTVTTTKRRGRPKKDKSTPTTEEVE